MVSTCTLFFFYRRQGRDTVEMLNLILPFPNVYISCRLFNNRKSAQNNKKVEGMKIFIWTGMITYVLTWFIFLKQICHFFFTKFKVKRLINAFDRHTVILVELSTDVLRCTYPWFYWKGCIPSCYISHPRNKLLLCAKRHMDAWSWSPAAWKQWNTSCTYFKCCSKVIKK